MIPSNISWQNIISAIGYIRENTIPKRRRATRFQLVVDNQTFPPKYVVSLANKYANGQELDPSKFNGGKETNLFLENLGFKIEEISSLEQHSKVRSSANPASRRAWAGSAPKAQRQALLKLLKQHFGVVKTEVSHNWLVVPSRGSMDNALIKIVEVLSSYRGYRNFFSPGLHLQVDYFIPSQSLIIEYDERQHFTIPRALALSNYPRELNLGFDKNAWISACKTTQATDRDPEYRDEQRAFYDSLRDILASRHGYTVLRIKDKEYDWTLSNAASELNKLLVQVARNARRSNIQPQGQSMMSKTAQAGAKTRIVSACVLGQSLENIHSNAERQKLLQKTIHEIGNRGWSDIDALILPGGFFCLDKYLGSLPYAERVTALENASFHNVCTNSCQYLSHSSPGVIIIIGVDGTTGPEDSNYFWSDQLCVAWNKKGIAGIGRKVFPTSDDESSHYICYSQDYERDNRIIPLPHGANAILCACYDVFGCAETAERPTSRTSNICNITTGTGAYNINNQRTRHERSVFKELRQTCINDFHNLLVTHKVAVGLGAIHNFRKPGRDNYWQRHGIQACSAALGSGLAVGAAHFLEGLPSISKSTLAATGILETYLSDKPFYKRKKNGFSPKDGFYAANETVLVRLFEF